MTQIIGLTLRPLDLDTVGFDRLGGHTALVPQPCDRGGLIVETGIGIEQCPMRRRIDKRTVIVLTVDFHEHSAEAPQRLDRYRLIVDESAGLAVDRLDPAQDQVVLRLDPLLLQKRACRMLSRHVEDRGDLPLLGTLAHQTGIAAPAKRKRKRVEQNRFARAGLAGQHGEPFGEIEIELVDQNDVANGQTDQHAKSL